MELRTFFLFPKNLPPNFELFPTETWDFFDFLRPPPIWTVWKASLSFDMQLFQIDRGLLDGICADEVVFDLLPPGYGYKVVTFKKNYSQCDNNTKFRGCHGWVFFGGSPPLFQFFFSCEAGSTFPNVHDWEYTVSIYCNKFTIK